MSNVPLMFQPLVKYADFQGRARRSEFWLWVLFRYIVGGVLGAFAGSAMFNSMSTLMANPHQDPQVFMQHYMSSMGMIIPLIQLVNLGLLIPNIAVGVRRLHDIGRSGWWWCLPIAAAIVAGILFLILGGAQIFSIAGHADKMSDAEGAKFALGIAGTLLLSAVIVLIAEIVMLVFYVTEGERRANRFGPDPKGEALNTTP